MIDLSTLKDKPGIQPEVREIVMPAQADLAGAAVLTDVINAHNALLQKLRDAGLMEE